MTPREKSYGKKERNWRLWNLLMSMISIDPFIRNLSISRDPLGEISSNSFPENYHPRLNYLSPYSPKITTELFIKGGDVKYCYSSPQAKDYVKHLITEKEYVTLTPRIATWDSTRDSNLDAWYSFYRNLTNLGHKVFLIPDQDDFLTNRFIYRYDWPVIGEVAMSLDLKLSVYEGARANIVAAGGNIGCLLFSEAPFSIINMIHEQSQVANEAYLRRVGYEVGSQFPWFRDSQRIVWTGDSKEELRDLVSKI